MELKSLKGLALQDILTEIHLFVHRGKANLCSFSGHDWPFNRRCILTGETEKNQRTDSLFLSCIPAVDSEYFLNCRRSGRECPSSLEGGEAGFEKKVAN